tara:strand:- start:722 stop:3286 length:2565 start_codon:yes stop_codon:yes gene_type:complete
VLKNFSKSGWVLLIALVWCGLAPNVSSAEESDIDEMVVVGASDYYSIMPDEPSESAFGLNKSLVETPRSLTEVREDLVTKFALRSVDDLVRLTPGSFTSSFFGIKGAMDIRGEPADNYFRGFRRVANPGAFNTIVRGAEKLEVLRGPVSPLYGSGSVGGQLNYTPKSAKVDGDKYVDSITSGIDVTVGSYSKKIISGNIGIPFMIGDKDAGVHLFAEVEDSESFFHFYEPSSSLVQASFDIDLSEATQLEFGFQYQVSDSIQVPGWTRITQDLIDNGTYITGLPQVLNSANAIGNDTLLPQESALVASFAPGFLNNAFSRTGSFCGAADPGTGNAVFDGFELSCPGAFGNFLGDRTLNNPFELTNVGEAQIDHRTTFIDTVDYADTTAITAYFDVTHELDNGMVWKNEIFYDYLEHTKYQSWGFTAFYPGVDILELRSSLRFEISGDAMTSSNIIGINYRTEDLEMNHAWFDETFDFRDMTVGPTANDRISPAVFDPYAAGAELITDPNTGAVTAVDGTLLRNFNEVHYSTSDNIGIFYLSDISVGRLGILAGVRLDSFDVESEDGWITYLGQAQGNGVIQGSDTEFSYNMSLSYKGDGVVPYGTYSVSNSPSTNQVGGVVPATIADGEYIQESTLGEIGVKFDLFDGQFYSALAAFDQEKTYRDSQTNALVAVFGQGIEFEARALINDNLSLLATATHSDTSEVSNGALAVINGADFAAQNGLEPWEVYGGRIAGNRANFVGENVELDRGGLPDNIFSAYATWFTPTSNGDFTANFGFTWVDETYTDIFETILLPSYTIWNGSVSYSFGDFTALAQVNNILDEEYYTSADLFDSVVVKPSEGRTISLTLSYRN